MTFNVYKMSAPLALAALRAATIKDVVRDRARTVQFPCEFYSRRAEKMCSYGLCRTECCISATNVRTYGLLAPTVHFYIVLTSCFPLS